MYAQIMTNTTAPMHQRLLDNLANAEGRYARGCANVEAAIERGDLPADYVVEDRHSIRGLAGQIQRAQRDLDEYLAKHPELAR